MPTRSKDNTLDDRPPAQAIDERIVELGDWRGERLARIRAIVKQTVPDVVEQWKYRGVPIWWRDGVLCTGETHKAHVKMTFPKGASLPDPSHIFNGTTGGSTWRAIDLRKDDELDEDALRALLLEAVKANQAKTK